MKVTIEDIQSKFDALQTGSQSRESVAEFAAEAMIANESDLLEMEPADLSDKIWKAILYLSGVDMKESPTEYLHVEEDFSGYRMDLGI